MGESNYDKLMKNLKIGSFLSSTNYQLNIEDADMMARNDIVLFVDASEEPIEDFCITTVQTQLIISKHPRT